MEDDLLLAVDCLLRERFNSWVRQFGSNIDAFVNGNKAYDIADNLLSQVRAGSKSLEDALTLCALVGHAMGMRIVYALKKEKKT